MFGVFRSDKVNLREKPYSGSKAPVHRYCEAVFRSDKVILLLRFVPINLLCSQDKTNEGNTQVLRGGFSQRQGKFTGKTLFEFEGARIQLIISAFLGYEIGVTASLNYLAVVEHHYNV